MARVVALARLAAALRSRGFASQSGDASLAAPSQTLKQVLKQLYLRVHPDLFTDSPREQADNARSFVLLREYLELLESSAEPQGRAQVFDFVFWLRRSPGDAADAAADATREETDTGNGLRRVAVKLPPPGRRQPGQDRNGLAPSTALALGRLLSACGLESSFSGGATDCAAPEGLLDVLPGAAETLRQTESAARTPDDHIRMARAALRMGRGVMLSFGAGCPAAAAQRAELARLLAAALDASPADFLRGAAVVLADRYGVHPGTGQVFLDCRAPADWPARLLAVDVRAAEAARHAAKARKEAEEALADAMHVQLLCADDALGRSPAYADFLARLRSTAEARGPAAGSALCGVPVRVGPAPAAATDVTAGFELDGDGVLCVPLTAAGDDIYAFLAHAGPRAAATRAAMASRERSAADAALAARRVLRLRHLVRAEGLPAEVFAAACARLLRFRQALAPHVEGLPLRIVSAGTLTAISPCGAFIDVPADFELTTRRE